MESLLVPNFSTVDDDVMHLSPEEQDDPARHLWMDDPMDEDNDGEEEEHNTICTHDNLLLFPVKDKRVSLDATETCLSDDTSDHLFDATTHSGTSLHVEVLVDSSSELLATTSSTVSHNTTDALDVVIQQDPEKTKELLVQLDVAAVRSQFHQDLGHDEVVELGEIAAATADAIMVDAGIDNLCDDINMMETVEPPDEQDEADLWMSLLDDDDSDEMATDAVSLPSPTNSLTEEELAQWSNHSWSAGAEVNRKKKKKPVTKKKPSKKAALPSKPATVSASSTTTKPKSSGAASASTSPTKTSSKSTSATTTTKSKRTPAPKPPPTLQTWQQRRAQLRKSMHRSYQSRQYIVANHISQRAAHAKILGQIQQSTQRVVHQLKLQPWPEEHEEEISSSSGSKKANSKESKVASNTNVSPNDNNKSTNGSS